MNSKDTIKRIVHLAMKLDEVEELDCTCTGFVMQYEGGCCCNKSVQREKVKKEFWALIDEIKGGKHGKVYQSQ